MAIHDFVTVALVYLLIILTCCSLLRCCRQLSYLSYL